MGIDPSKFKSCGFLQTFSPDDLAFIMEISSEENYPAGSAVFHEGDTNSDLFLLINGEADVDIKISAEDTEVNIHVVPEGSVFGHFSFIDRQPRSATIRAKTDIVVLRISRKDFDEFKLKQPFLALHLIEALTSTISQAIRGENVFLQSFLDYRAISAG
ncbi:MAG: cyclic nucleotide-binding domain-containing protein [bacterium]|nr:cyclic nucleotide-binding domain-containing protein [bacterium]